MSQGRIFLLRHGETEWSRSGKHTGRTDIPLTDRGRLLAKATGGVGRYLLGDSPFVVWSSPRVRARDTAELAGAGFDFAIAEQCVEFGECGEYAAQYGDAVLAVEYPGPTTDACADGDRPSSTVVRDRELSRPGDVGYLFRRC